MGTWRTLRVPDRILGGQGHFDVMDVLSRPQGSYPESFMLISLLEVCQEWGIHYVGTWRMLSVADRRLGGQGHP